MGKQHFKQQRGCSHNVLIVNKAEVVYTWTRLRSQQCFISYFINERKWWRRVLDRTAMRCPKLSGSVAHSAEQPLSWLANIYCHVCPFVKGQRKIYTHRHGENEKRNVSLTPMLARKSSPPKTTASRERPTWGPFFRASSHTACKRAEQNQSSQKRTHWREAAWYSSVIEPSNSQHSLAESSPENAIPIQPFWKVLSTVQGTYVACICFA